MRGQYISRPGFCRLVQGDMVAAARGMEGWLRHPRPVEQSTDYRELARKETMVTGMAATVANGRGDRSPPPPQPGR